MYIEYNEEYQLYFVFNKYGEYQAAFQTYGHAMEYIGEI